MKLNDSIIENCLYSNFSIDFWLNLRKKSFDITDEEKEKINSNLVLLNQFLLRRIQDPGFLEYVCQCILEDDKALKYATEYIEKTYYEYVEGLNEKIFVLTPMADNEDKEPRINLVNPMDDYENLEKLVKDVTSQLHEIEKVSSMNIGSYLKIRHENAIYRHDEDEAEALQWLIKEHETGKVYVHNLLDVAHLYRIDGDSNKWVLKQARYINQNLKYLDSYATSYDLPEDARLLSTFSYIDPRIMDIFYGLVCKLQGREKNPKSELHYMKFITDAISIASEIWFNSHTETEKIGILNNLYNFDLSEKYIEELAKVNQAFLLYRAQDLYTKQFFCISEKIYKYIFDNTDNLKLKYCASDAIACINRENGDFNTALEYFKIALDHAKFTNEEPDYKKAVCLKNMAEMYYHLGKRQDADRCFSNARRMAGLSTNERIRVLHNISVAYKRLHKYNNEYDVLDEISKYYDEKQQSQYPDLVKIAFVNVMERQILIDQYSYKNSKGIVNNAVLEEIDLKEEYERYMDIGNSLQKAFQFDLARTYYKKSYDTNKNKDALELMIKSSLDMDDNDYALHLINKYQEDFRENASALMYEAIFHIRDNNIESALECIETAIRQKDEYQARYPNILKILIPELFIMKNDNLSNTCFDKIAYMTYLIHKNPTFYTILAGYLLQNGFIEESIDYFKRDMSIRKDSTGRYADLLNIGSAYKLNGEYEKSIIEYDNATKIDDKNHVGWYLLSDAHASNLDFLNAQRCIDTAIPLCVDSKIKKEYAIQKKYYDELACTVINYKVIIDDDVRKILMSAEKMVLQLYSKMDKPKDFDFSMVIIYYGKAVEIMLHRHITEKIKEYIGQKHKRIPDKLFNGYKYNGSYIPGLPWSFKPVFGDAKKSFTTGQWAYLPDDINKYKSNPVVKDIDDYLCNNLPDKISIISRACFNIFELRNKSAHSEIKTHDEVTDERRNIIENLNNIIIKIYN